MFNFRGYERLFSFSEDIKDVSCFALSVFLGPIFKILSSYFIPDEIDFIFFTG